MAKGIGAAVAAYAVANSAPIKAVTPDPTSVPTRGAPKSLHHAIQSFHHGASGASPITTISGNS